MKEWKAHFYDKALFTLKLILAAFWFLCAYKWTLDLKCMHLKWILDLLWFEPHYWNWRWQLLPLRCTFGIWKWTAASFFQRQIMCGMAITNLEWVDRVFCRWLCWAVWVQTRFVVCATEMHKADLQGWSLSFPRRRPQCKRGAALLAALWGDSVCPWPGEGTLRVPMVGSWALFQPNTLAHSGLLHSLPFPAFPKIHLQCFLCRESVYIPYLSC